MAADGIALEANRSNNAMHQQLRLDRWSGVRDRLWELLEPLIDDGARVALIGAGSCDDVPLRRIVGRAGVVDLVDIDGQAMERARTRVDPALRPQVVAVELDVTGGCAEQVLRAVRDEAPLPDSLPLPRGPIARGGYDLVVGDMLYTQLLHAGLIALGIEQERQRSIMRRYDPPVVRALVERIESSLAPGGHAVHVHDVACWSNTHPQPVALPEALADPELAWERLRRHDGCDPHLALQSGAGRILGHAWWEWPFEPNKQFLVRATVTRAQVGAGSALAPLLRRT